MDYGYVSLACYSLDCLLALFNLIQYQGAISFRVECIQNPYRNVFFHSRYYSLGMQYFSAKVRKFRGLCKGNLLKSLRVFNNLGVSGHYPINISPYLDFACIYSRSDNACCVVRASPSKSGYFAFSRFPYKSRNDWNNLNFFYVIT